MGALRQDLISVFKDTVDNLEAWLATKPEHALDKEDIDFINLFSAEFKIPLPPRVASLFP